jgi:ketosteroid isomerase-like protein
MRILESAWSARDADKLAAAYAPDARVAFPGFPDASGRGAIEETARSFWAAFPDAKYAWSRTWHAAGIVVVESAWSGTNTGAIFGAKPTRKTAGGVALTLTGFAPAGVVREQHIYADLGSLAMQVGLPYTKGRPFDGLPTSREEYVADGTLLEEANVEIVRAGLECVARRDLKGFVAWMAADAEYVDFTRPGSFAGKSGIEKWFRSWTSFSPDLAQTTTGLWGVQDFVIREYATQGSQNGARVLPGARGAQIFQIREGKLQRAWGYANALEIGRHAR